MTLGSCCAIHSRGAELFIFVMFVWLAMSNIQVYLLQQFQQVQTIFFQNCSSIFESVKIRFSWRIATILRGSSLAATLSGWKAAKLPARLLWIQVSNKGKEINILLVGTQQKSGMKNNTDERSGKRKECHWYIPLAMPLVWLQWTIL